MTISFNQFAARVSQCSHSFMQLGWPNQLSIALVAAAVITSACAWVIHQHTQDLSSKLQFTKATLANSKMRAEPAVETLFVAPQDTQYIQDLGRLFQIGQEASVTLGVIEYKFEINPKAPLIVRTIDLRTNEDYPRIKGFVSKVLNEIPHATLQEIRIERKDVQTSQGALLIKLSLVYQARH